MGFAIRRRKTTNKGDIGMMTENEKLIDFEVYKYSIPNLLHIIALMAVLLITLVFYIVCLPFIWLVPTQKMFRPLENLISELT